MVLIKIIFQAVYRLSARNRCILGKLTRSVKEDRPVWGIVNANLEPAASEDFEIYNKNPKSQATILNDQNTD